MGKLIDADKLIEYIDAGHLRNPNELCFSEIDVVNMLLHAPIAYDLDAVVERLEDEEAQSYNDFEDYAEDQGLTRDDDWHCMGLKRAIEIVKGGGVNGKINQDIIRNLEV